MRSIKSSCDVIHDASNLLDVRPASSMRCGTIRRAHSANKRPSSSRHVAQKAQCARPVAQKRRAGVLASAGARAWPRRCTRAGERSAGLFVGVCVTRTTRTCPNIRDLILKCTNTQESAQLGLGTQICVIILAILGLATRTREVRQRIVIKQSNTTQKSKNQIPLVIPPYHTTPKKNQNNQNTGSIPVNIEHCSPLRRSLLEIYISKVKEYCTVKKLTI